jgi:transglutaminase-like putative cysteine protease
VAMATPRPQDTAGKQLALSIGCTFGLNAAQPAPTIMQVAPALESDLSFRYERWNTDAYHHTYVDDYGNRCERFELPVGDTLVAYQAEVVLSDPGDLIEPETPETPVSLLPDDVFGFVMPSRFCLPDELGNDAWQLFGNLSPGWSRVQAIVDFVHNHIEYTPGSSNPWTTAADVYRSGQGVCRDYAHLAISFCRALNIPARYVFGYIPDFDVPAPTGPNDFAAWFEVYLDGRWHTFDARNNRPLVGRIVVARGRDAVDVALLTSFGPLALTSFEVHADVAVTGISNR